MNYKQLAQAQRYQIYALRKHVHNQTEIARLLGVLKSTISRELRRKQVQRPAEVWQQVEAKLHEDWSPEQVSIWLREQGERLSHERIY